MSEDVYGVDPVLPSRRQPPAEGPADYPDLDYENGEPPYPQTVKAAGVIWIVFGCLILLNLMAILLMTFVFAANVGGQAAAGVVSGGVCTAFIIGLFGAVFLQVGNQSIRGTARDTLGNGVGSILFALLELGGAAAYGNFGQFVQAGVAAVGGALLLTAGVLALVGRSQYNLWRKAQKSQQERAAADRKARRRFIK